MKRRRGFTLIELTVVLAITAVVLGLVIVQVDGWSSRQSLDASARALGNTVRFWRERAQDDEVTYSLRLDVEHATYRVTGAREILRGGRLGVGQTFGKIHAGEAEMKGPVILNFGPRGILPEVAITLQNAANEKVTLKLGSMANEVSYVEAK
jgi:prepilin-type N-terminal cleavage/methylation domain-containing protein